MSDHADFYRASIPDKTRLLGIDLRPLSLGHVILLHRISSPYVMAGSPDVGDLAIAILICSLPFTEGISLLSDPTRDRALALWHAKLTGMNRWSVALGLRKPRRIDYVDVSNRFCEYLTEHSKIPTYAYTPGDFGQIHCPHVELVKVTLMRDLHIPESEILDRSWSLCLWDYVVLKALAGHVSMYDPDEIAEAQARADRLQAILDAKLRKDTDASS